MYRLWFLFSWCILGVLAAPILCGQQAAAPTTAETTEAETTTAETTDPVAASRQINSPQPSSQRPATNENRETQAVHHEPPEGAAARTQQPEALAEARDRPESPSAEDITEDPFEEERREAPIAPRSAPSGQGALERQAASIQRQLGRTRRSGRAAGTSGASDFFVSSWFTSGNGPMAGSPAGLGSHTPQYEVPSDCEPLDRALAEAFMRDSATREGVSLDLVREIIRQESGFQPCVVSSKGAMGMMQLMPDTASSLGVLDPFDPRQNIDGGVRLLRRLLDKYQGRPDLALAAYNAGEGAVDRNNDVPDYEETRDYVRAIMRRVFESPPEKASSKRAPRIAAPARIASPRNAIADGAEFKDAAGTVAPAPGATTAVP